MTNDYRSAAVIEIGNAQDIVMGEKPICGCIDNLTLEFGNRFNPETND
jgi:hypothetical protein